MKVPLPPETAGQERNNVSLGNAPGPLPLHPQKECTMAVFGLKAQGTTVDDTDW